MIVIIGLGSIAVCVIGLLLFVVVESQIENLQSQIKDLKNTKK